jgi:hypothetical protein
MTIHVNLSWNFPDLMVVAPSVSLDPTDTPAFLEAGDGFMRLLAGPGRN